MITLIHGDDIEASRKEFNTQKSKSGHIEQLDGKKVDETILTQALSSASLFGETKTVFIDNLFGKLGRKTKLIESLAKIIKDSAVDIVLWEDKEVGTTVIKNLGNAKVTLFKLPVLIFQFLDHPTISTYQKVVETESAELVHAMLQKRLRQLIQIADGVMPEGLQGWQLARLTAQSKSFTMDKLLGMYKKLLEMEFSVKNGSSPFTISQLTQQMFLHI